MYYLKAVALCIAPSSLFHHIIWDTNGRSVYMYSKIYPIGGSRVRVSVCFLKDMGLCITGQETQFWQGNRMVIMMKTIKEKKVLFSLLKRTHSDLQQSVWCSVFLNFQARKLLCRVSNIPCLQTLICILGLNRMLF